MDAEASVMLNWLKSLFSSGPDLGELLAEGALVVDVRSLGEYQSGHVKGSMHVPLPQLSKKINAVKKQKKTVITVCASGMRSGKAAKVLRSHGVDAHNGGPWQSVQRRQNGE
jgi:phage shock protein E